MPPGAGPWEPHRQQPYPQTWQPPQGGPPPGYFQPTNGGPYYPLPPIAAARAKNPAGYAALTCAIFGLLVFPLILGAVAVILGVIGAVYASSHGGVGLRPAIGGMVLGLGEIILSFALLAG